MICTDILVPVNFLFSDSVPQLLYYSHIPTAFISLIVSYFILRQNKTLASYILLFVCLIFSTWLTLNLIIWTNVESDLLIFATSLFGILNVFLFLSVAYFFYTFIHKSDISFFQKILWLTLTTPFILLSQNNVSGFSLPLCESTGGQIYYTAIYIFEFFVFLAILFTGIIYYIKEKTNFVFFF